MGKNLLFVVISCLMLLASVEGFLRWLDIGDPPVFEEHPDYGYLMQPNQSVSTRGHRFHINRAGFRGDNFAWAKSGDIYRIAFVGDSITYGGGSIMDPDLLYSPPYIAWYGLVHLEQYLRGTNPAGRSVFLKQVGWLEAHVVRRPRGEAIWPMTFDWREGRCVLKAPWVSAYAQGFVISALVRGYRITGEAHLVDMCRSAAQVFAQDVEVGGVRSREDRAVFYAEYPCSGAPRILDGFLTSLLGLYDLFVQTEDPLVLRLFSEGVKGLQYLLPYWSYRGKWGWYGSRYYLCSPGYHQLNRALLLSVSRVAGEPALERYVEMWDPARLTMLGRLEVFLVFILSKNFSRLKYQTWREKPNAPEKRP